MSNKSTDKQVLWLIDLRYAAGDTLTAEDIAAIRGMTKDEIRLATREVNTRVSRKQGTRHVRVERVSFELQSMGLV